jgi:hypothetical protein
MLLLVAFTSITGPLSAPVNTGLFTGKPPPPVPVAHPVVVKAPFTPFGQTGALLAAMFDTLSPFGPRLMLAAGNLPQDSVAPAVQFQVNAAGLYDCTSSAEIPL